MVTTGGHSWPAMSAFMWLCASHHVVKCYERFSVRRKHLKKDLIVEIVKDARWWILCVHCPQEAHFSRKCHLFSFFNNYCYFSFRPKAQMMRSPTTPEIRVILRVISGPNHRHCTLDNPFWRPVWKYYFGLSLSICWRHVLTVLINTVTAITIGILQKIPSLPLCLNPICSPFVCLIKASKNGSASFSLPLIRYLHDRDDMRTAKTGKKKQGCRGREGPDKDPARPPCHDACSPRRPCCSSVCGNAEAITCFPSVLRVEQERAQHTETEINCWKTETRGDFAANEQSEFPSVADHDARRWN